MNSLTPTVDIVTRYRIFDKRTKWYLTWSIGIPYQWFTAERARRHMKLNRLNKRQYEIHRVETITAQRYSRM